MASRRAFAARHDAALVALAVLVAMALLVAGADAGRWSHKHRHHHRGRASPPAPPGFDQPTAAPSPPFFGDGPAASPFAQTWSHHGPEEPVADSAPSVAPADSPLPWDGSPKAAPSLESGFY